MLATVAPMATACAQSDGGEAERRAAMLRMVEGVKADYPDVRTISAEGLIAALATEDILLVDVRSDEERGVSTIPGAISARDFEARLAELTVEGRTVVAYCTIGARSSAYARRMAGRGVDMLNLEGSVLAWTHAGGEFMAPTGPTRRLHVYGRRWNLAADGYETVW
ncbi:MAG: rhodanese-like domain-containing protein [Gemmatimonadetes bacterium]|nr:rhodanese-like domain-containing protein [Gemmatimonadota bacterium]